MKFSIFVNRPVIALLLFAITACNSKNSGEGSPPPDSKFRVVGYLFSSGGNWLETFDTLDLDLVTDLNLAFVAPDTDGNFAADANLANLVNKAHAKNMRVFFSIGGGNPPEHMASLIEPANRANFAASMANFAVANNFDGVDIDLENALINEDYAPFVWAVHQAMKAKGKMITAALASWNANAIHDTTLARYDAIHIMSYDKTGPWNTANPGQHSPYSMAVDDLNYFINTRNQPAEKLTVGLPFYGYGFGNGVPSSIAFKDIVLQYPGFENVDEITVAQGGKIYYNGKNSIQEKIKLARNRKAMGVMIWQLAGDAKAPHSLLATIEAELEQ